VNAFFAPSQGLLNALVYFQRSSKKEFKDLFLVRHARRLRSSVEELFSEKLWPPDVTPIRDIEEDSLGKNVATDNQTAGDRNGDTASPSGEHQGEATTGPPFEENQESKVDMRDRQAPGGESAIGGDASSGCFVSEDLPRDRAEESLEGMFSATREHWRLNFMDDDIVDPQSESRNNDADRTLKDSTRFCAAT